MTSDSCVTMTSLIPPPPPLLRHNSRASNTSGNSGSTSGFRLNDEFDTSSVYSVYKQQIDKMFSTDLNEQNNIQVRIEKMFNEVAHEGGIKDENRHVFSVDYLGSVPLQEKVSNLHGLQDPLKKLYFTYKKTMKKKLTGRLEISSNGLKVIYQGENGILEQLNPYPTIAVWSAVKFVIQDKKFAFLPLITDPDTCEKQNLFQLLDENNKYILNDNHQPLFTVVMRKIGLGRMLEMHSFVCQTSEDAIVIAATLYKSLMTYMKNKPTKPKNKNGISCLSISSSTFTDSIQPIRPPRKKKSTLSTSSTQSNTKKSTKTKKAPALPSPKKLPPTAETKKPQSDIEEIKPYEDPIDDLKRCRSLRKENITKINLTEGDILTKVTIPRSGSFLNTGGLTRYKSKVNRTNGLTSGGSPLGFSELFAEFRLQENLNSLDDILAAIVNPNGMSFNNLKPIYKEFLLKLAVTLTKDELYQRAKAIIRRKKRRERKKKTVGIGVQKIKRVFRKSFRLNLSRKIKKKKLMHMKNSSINVKSSTNISESTISSTSYDTKQFQPKETLNKKQNFRRKNSQKERRRDRLSTSEDSDFFTMKRKDKLSPSNQNRNSSSGYVSCSECSYSSDTCTCISADKCYCSLGNRHRDRTNFRQTMTSPMTSCRSCDMGTLSYCGCETDTCTESEKCYCNGEGKDHRKSKQISKLNKFDPKNRIFEELHKKGFFPVPHDQITNKKYKKIDKNYCIDKYCQKYYQKYNNNYSRPCLECEKCMHGFQQLKLQNLVQKNELPVSQIDRKLCKKNSNTRSTTSVEYMKNPAEKYYEKLKSKYENEIISQRRSYSENNLCSTDLITRELYGRALSEITPKNGLCSVRSFQSFNGNNRRNYAGKTLQRSIPSTAATEALSVKKSAEIAALFTDLKLSQTTDITHIVPKSFPASQLSGVRPRSFTTTANTKFDKQAIVTPYKHIASNKMVQNSLYGSRMVPNNKTGMYSTRNGLYTIQSQSDTSSSENGRKNNLENTLGYLP